MSTDPRFLPPTPFARLLRTQAITAIGDACLTASLAGSLFFEGTTSGARSRVLLYLLITMAPFAVVAPVIGPALDRVHGGRRLLMVLSLLVRSGLCFAMSRVILEPSPEGLLVYPLAFTMLVLAKGSSVAKSSLVPSLVERDDELVRANARLAFTTTVAGTSAGLPAFGVQALLGADWSLLIATAVYGLAGVVATRIPRVEPVRSAAEKAREREELHQPSILLAGSAMSALRGAVGFLMFFAAFALRDDKPILVAVAALGMTGGVCGTLVAPRLRDHVHEEWMLTSAAGLVAGTAISGALMTEAVRFLLASFAVGVGAAVGRLGFDSVLQRDGPDAVRGRAFARFETRFQMVWVVGAVLGLAPVSSLSGLLGLGAVMAFTAASYVAARRAIASGTRAPHSVRPQAIDRTIRRLRDRWTRLVSRDDPDATGE